ncbi:MAG: alpha-ketoacid dehydrogenase subunit beta [Candidatus Marinimicrobia bacterium]|nr:alpha-ketoacid dehydrogenase subunit beta [Candidatus Neomarinimicrobiota bacterium]|tara:strand:- start:2239 stop:3240 length:1002 start_codon:yes stop_codon:yes gene_type:complete
MAIKSYKDAINEALLQEMKKDENVVIMGEDVAGGAGTNGEQDAWGGVLGVTKGLLAHYGRERIIDTPITETAILGMASGAALTGLRPVAELMFVDFMGVCFDQILNQTAKFRYMFGGKAVTPVTIRTMYGGGLRAASQHSQCLYPMFTHVPGIKVVVPSCAYDAKGLLIQSIRDDDPVIYMEHKNLYDVTQEVPDESYTIPFGEANFTREGKDITFIGMGQTVGICNKVADQLKSEGKSSIVLDLRTLSPLDEDSVLEAAEETGKVVIVDESYPRCNIATDLSALICQQAFSSLKAPIKMVTPPHTPVPFSPPLEDLYLPSEEKVLKAAKEIL